MDRKAKLLLGAAAVLAILWALSFAFVAGAQTITAIPSSCLAGQACRPRLTWSGFECAAPSAAASPQSGSGWSGAKAPSGSQLVSTTTVTRTYTLTCPETMTANGTAALSCTPPTTNTDGSPLLTLQGYRFYWGAAPGTYSFSASRDAGSCAYLVTGLADGPWYFVATAVSTTGESAFSNIATKTITGNATIPPVSRSVTVTVGEAEPQPPAPATDIETGGTFTTLISLRRYFVGDTIPITTPVVTGATRYEWEIEHVEIRTIDARTSSTPSTTWTPQRAGPYVARVRPCNAAGCAAWLSTADRGYIMHAWLRAPGF